MAKTDKIGGALNSILPVNAIKEVLTDKEKRKHFLTHEDMEPHRHLAILLLITLVISLVVGILA